MKMKVLNIINLHMNLRLYFIKLNELAPKYKQLYNLEVYLYFPVVVFNLISGIISYKNYKL